MHGQKNIKLNTADANTARTGTSVQKIKKEKEQNNK